MNNIPPKAHKIMRLLLNAGAHDALIVGGFVRDFLLGVESKDVDIEIFGMSLNDISDHLKDAGFKVDLVGQSFGVIKVDNDIDVSIPRRESKNGVGHKGFDIFVDPDMNFHDASLRRDFTINAMGMRLDGSIVDPHGGETDLAVRYLRAVSHDTFADDPLRVLRAMQFAARFNMELECQTEIMCRNIVNTKPQLAIERVWEEWKKWALMGSKPSSGLILLHHTGWDDIEIRALVDVPQDQEWHPEGWLAEIPIDRDILTINPSFTGAAKPFGRNNGFCLGEILKDSFANTATGPHSGSASSAQSPDVDDPVDSLFRAPSARSLSSSLTPGLGEAVYAQPMRFVRTNATVATRASKVVRIMLDVPQPSMLCVMRSAIDDFQILNAIIEPVSIFMMNMLFGSKWSSQFQFHQNAVESDRPLFTGPANVSVTTIVADASSVYVNGDIIVGFDLCFEGNVDFIHDEFLVMDKICPSLFYTKVTQGDVFIHTCQVVDCAAYIANREELDDHNRMVLMFAALCHDFGKPYTTRVINGRIRAPGHCEAGVPLAEDFLNRIGAPISVRNAVIELVKDHLVHAGAKPTDKAVRRLANRLRHSSIRMLDMLVEADASGRMPLPWRRPMADWVDAANKLHLSSNPPRSILSGRHLIDLGVRPGPQIGAILKRAFNAQMDGRFNDLDGAIAWAREALASD